jgi:hypothetical protein
MSDNHTPYIEHSPGDLITSEDWNNVQVMIKEDIEGQVGQVKTELDDFKEAPVNADTFGGKTPDEWDQKYDERYVQHAELPAGWGEYQRYFKQIDRQISIADGESIYEPAIIEHNLHRYPLASIFELVDFGLQPSDVPEGTDATKLGKLKFFVYYAGHRDPVAERLMTRAADDVHWGDPLTLIMQQFGISPEPGQSFDDVLNTLWEKMFDPGLGLDHFRRDSYGHSRYIQEQFMGKDREKITVKDLQDWKMWEDLHMAIRPQMIPVGPPITGGASGSYTGPRVEVFHLSQNMLEIRVREEMDLMVLLRT